LCWATTAFFTVTSWSGISAAPKTLWLNCLPAYRGKEITAETLGKNAGTIFDQGENRLHAQKAPESRKKVIASPTQ
jgi:ornithine carbamoyltransferase